MWRGKKVRPSGPALEGGAGLGKQVTNGRRGSARPALLLCGRKTPEVTLPHAPAREPACHLGGEEPLPGLESAQNLGLTGPMSLDGGSDWPPSCTLGHPLGTQTFPVLLGFQLSSLLKCSHSFSADEHRANSSTVGLFRFTKLKAPREREWSRLKSGAS